MASETGSILYRTSYDAIGRVTQERYASSSGPLTSYVYYPWTAQGGRLQQILNSAAGYTRLDLRYTYDLMGNVASIADYMNGGPQTQSFTYDQHVRLPSALVSSGTSNQQRTDSADLTKWGAALDGFVAQNNYGGLFATGVIGNCSGVK